MTVNERPKRVIGRSMSETDTIKQSWVDRSSKVDEQQSRRRYDNRGSYANEQTASNVQVAPTVPSFGFQLPPNFTMPQGLAFLPGFSLPNGQQSNGGGS